MRPELDRHGVQIVTLSTDTPEEIGKGRHKHGLKAVMLSDRDLAVTRLYGVENKTTVARQPGIPGVPIPTTFMADHAHIVRWIDQAEDYRVRSQPDRVLEALRNALE